MLGVFFSCSLQPAEAELNAWFKAFCSGFGISCTTVDNASTKAPPVKARDDIERLEGFIAIVTRRKRIGKNKFLMPSSVRDEIAIAFSHEKPLLIFVERGVEMDGLVPPSVTYKVFDRDSIHTPAFAQTLVEALENFRREVLEQIRAVRYEFAPDYRVKEIKSVLSVRYANSRYVWHTSITRDLHFEHAFEGELTSAVWPNPRWSRPGLAFKGDWEIVVLQQSKKFELQARPVVLTGDHLDLRIKLSPAPQPGDYIVYTRRFVTPYLNPLFADEKPVESLPGVTIGGAPFDVYDGVAIVERTNNLHYHCSFPVSYGLVPEQIRAFCGERSGIVDRVALTETKRLKPTIVVLDEEIVVDLRVEHPQEQLFYGIAWNLPIRG